jgi:hypothetical protein
MSKLIWVEPLLQQGMQVSYTSIEEFQMDSTLVLDGAAFFL